MRYLAVIGDPHSHGGNITRVSSSMDINGKHIALVGDEVSCPKHGPNTIVEGIAGWDDNGRLVVGHLCKTACGAEIYASQTEVEL